MAKTKLTKDVVNAYSLIAHRGLHGNGVSENSLKAFSLAIENGLAFELDCHLSKDGRLIVCHDSDLGRVTGSRGFIPDLTLQEIKEKYRLHDGQEVPSLEEVLSLNAERSPMVIELKVDKKNDAKIASAVLKALEGIKDKDKVSLISFYPKALRKCAKSRFSTGLLVYSKHPILKRLSFLFDYLDVEELLLDDPYYAKYRKKGGFINTWTIESKSQLKRIQGEVDMVTFQHLPIEEVRLALRRKEG